MALPAGPEAQRGKLVVRNVGLMLSGRLEEPILGADALVAENGRITAVGRSADLDTGDARVTVDAHGCAVSPGLIDSHVHPAFGDWTPRQNQLGWIDSTMHGGVTTMVSAGEVHLPGRPRDIVGLKALAIAAQRAFTNYRPSGVKVLAGAPIVEQGMVEQDFADLAAAGVTMLGEVGLGSVKAGDEARTMVAWARKHGMVSTIHTGGPSVPGSGYMDADTVLQADADVIGHINGGHTALPLRQIRCLCEGCGRAMEIVHNGNELAGLTALRYAREMGQMERVILGTDAPAGSGVQPSGHPAYGGDAVVARRRAGGGAVLLRHRQHRPDAPAGLRDHRGGPGRGPGVHGPGAALRRRRPAGERAGRGPARHWYGDHRRHRPLRPQPEHAAGGAGAGGGGIGAALHRSLSLRERVGVRETASVIPSHT